MNKKTIKLELTDLPADHRDLLNLYDLKNKFEIYDILKNNITNYVLDYFKQNLKNNDDILNMINPDEHDLYLKNTIESFKIIKQNNSEEFHDNGDYWDDLDIEDETIVENNKQYMSNSRYDEIKGTKKLKTLLYKINKYNGNILIVNFNEKIILQCVNNNYIFEDRIDYKMKDNKLYIIINQYQRAHVCDYLYINGISVHRRMYLNYNLNTNLLESYKYTQVPTKKSKLK